MQLTLRAHPFASHHVLCFEGLERRDLKTIPAAIPFDASMEPVSCNGPNGAACLLADANMDNQVGFVDFLILSNNYGMQGATKQDGDFDGDGVVGFNDFLILFNGYGTGQ